MELQPLNNYLIVEPVQSEKTPGGIILAQSVDNRPRWYRVVSVGPGLADMFANRQKPEVAPGEYIYVFPYAVHTVRLKDYGFDEDGEHHVVSEGDVLVRSSNPAALDLRPVGAYLIVERVHLPENRTAGGIYLPDKAVPPPALATVRAVGSGYRTAANGFIKALVEAVGRVSNREDWVVVIEALEQVMREHVRLSVEPGDTIVVVNTAPLELNLETFGIDQKFHIVGEGDVLAVLSVSNQHHQEGG